MCIAFEYNLVMKVLIDAHIVLVVMETGIQSNLSTTTTLGTEDNNCCINREVAVMGRGCTYIII